MIPLSGREPSAEILSEAKEPAAQVAGRVFTLTYLSREGARGHDSRRVRKPGRL